MKKQSTFLSVALMVLAITLTAFFAAGCSGSTNVTVPKVGNLPAFPVGVSPAETEAAADSILAELKQSGLIGNINRMREVYMDYESRSDDDNFSFKDLSDSDEIVKVSASKKISQKKSKGFEKVETDYDGLLKTNDYIQILLEVKMKEKVTNDITYENVTIAAGNIIEEQWSRNQDISVTQAGTISNASSISNAKCKVSYSDTSQETFGLTVTTSAGGVKIILDVTNTKSFSESNFPLFKAINDMSDYSKQKYSGSLKVYGKNNALLKTVTVTDNKSYEQAMGLFGVGVGVEAAGRELVD